MSELDGMEVDYPMRDWVSKQVAERGEDGMLVGVGTADEENTVKVVNWSMEKHDEVFREMKSPPVLVGGALAGDIVTSKERLEEPTHIVDKPAHYMVFPDMESKDIIQRVLTKEEYIGWMKGSILGYRLRAGNKDDALQDIAKAEKFKVWLGDLV